MNRQKLEKQVLDIEDKLAKSLSLPISQHENVAKSLIREKVLETYRLIKPIPTRQDFRYLNGKIVDDVYRVYKYNKNMGAALSLLTTSVLAEGVIQKARTDITNEVEFVTEEDERVCPLCDELSGTVWELPAEFDEIERPPIHPNCRCRLEITEGELTIS